MTTLSIKDVPEPWAEVLRQRAADNHRSLQGELMAILESVVNTHESNALNQPAKSWVSRPSLVQPEKDGARRKGSRTLEQIMLEHLARHPEPFVTAQSAVEMIREDRDSR